MFNYWFQRKEIPKQHDTVRNFFIYKNEVNVNGNTIDEFRPISATSLFFKIIEITIK